mgnify:FL=1
MIFYEFEPFFLLNILVVKEIMPNFVRSFGYTITT